MWTLPPGAVRQELDVRGMALDEAIPEVEKFIDDAMLSSLGEVSIIHGNGTGVLRAGIQDCLRRHPCVSSFRLGRYGDGRNRRYHRISEIIEDKSNSALFTG